MHPTPLDGGPVPVKGKWNPVLYGFVEFDAIHDSTQSYGEGSGNTLIARPGTWGAKHGRTQFTARSSRFGFRLSAPELMGIRASGVIEVDFNGNQPPTAYQPYGISEAATFNNPSMRFRQAAIKVETDYVDVVAGQYWQLFGWQGYFFPCTLDLRGVPGDVYGRTPQFRLSHMFKTEAVNVELAAAAVRPVQRNSEYPDGQAGLRVLVNSWKGVHTVGGTPTLADPLAIGVSGTVRRFRLPNLAADPTVIKAKTGWGVSIDGLIPVIPGTMADRANALTLTGSFVTGAGISDQYIGLTGGVTFPALPANAAGTVPTYPQDVDTGLVTYDSSGNLQTVKWQSYMGGLQYYLPPSGKLWIAGNITHLKSDNNTSFGQAAAAMAKIVTQSTWWDANLLWEVVEPLRVGVQYAQGRQTYGDGVEAKNERFQMNAFYLF
jgi:hypothetical protein